MVIHVFDLIDGVSLSQLQAQKLRLARSQGPYYGGSLPNVNQIGRTPQDFQVIDCTFTLMSLPVSSLVAGAGQRASEYRSISADVMKTLLRLSIGVI